jgi:HEAT repeat protein
MSQASKPRQVLTSDVRVERAFSRTCVFGRTRTIRIVLLCLICFALAPRLALAQVSGASLTPIQREIETQRARLSSTEVEERRDAVTRLGAMARPDAARAVVPALVDREPVVRATAARAVLSLPRDEAARLLLPLLHDKQEFVRRETAYALGLARSTTAIDDLIVALSLDKEAGVRGASAVALGQIGDARAVPALSDALGRRVSRGLVNRATLRKTEENDFVRRAAAISLGQIKSREGVPALVAALTNERAGDDVRRESARALGLIGDKSATPALNAALTARDPYLSQLALEALRKIDPNGAIRPARNPAR